MPYKIVKKDNEFCVQKKDGSKTFGCHSTENEAKKQLAAIYANSKEPRDAEDFRDLHLLGATGQVHTEIVKGREHLVVPVIALVEGVIHASNSEEPEFVSMDVIKTCAKTWEGKPVTLGHPKGKDGKQCSANHEEILASHGIGFIRKPRVEGKKFLCEALIDKIKAKTLHSDMYARLLDGEREEVSVGAFVFTQETPGEFNGKHYGAAWVDAQGDHLAFLPDGRGACSIEMGCGAHRAAMHFIAAEGIEMRTLEEHAQDIHGTITFTTLEGESLDARIAAVEQAVRKEWNEPPQPYAWVQSVFDDHVIVYKGEDTYSVPYTVDKDGVVTLGKATKVKMAYVAAAGARHSTTDMKAIQAVHDHAVALGAKCDKSNIKAMEEKKPVKPSDPTQFYIERVRREAAAGK